MRALRIVYGGSFDPIHLGHMRVIETLHALWPEALISLTPCKTGFFEKRIQTSEGQRLTMIELATRGLSYVKIDDQELKRSPPSYSIDTLKNLRDHYPDEAIAIAIGEDAYQKFEQWKGWQEFVSLCHLIVVNRSPQIIAHPMEVKSTYTRLEKQHASKLSTQACGLFLPLVIAPIVISSTSIRQRRSKNQSLESLVPSQVEAYIQENDLYL